MASYPDRSNTWAAGNTAAALRRWQGRLLQPSHRPSVGVDGVAGTTAYRHDGLSLHSGDSALAQRVERAIEKATEGSGCRCEFSAHAVRFVADRAGSLPDPFAVLNTVRRSGDAEVVAAVGLDHLLSMAEQVGGNPFALGHGRPGLDQYGLGYAGRGPLVLAGPEPRRRTSRRQPRVVVLDTGIGDHPWFRSDPAVTTVRLSDRAVGPQIDPKSIRTAAADGFGLIDNAMLGTLGNDAGHGTFIAGLLRQACPEAEIVSLAVMGSDGIVPETTLTEALSVLLQKQQEQPGWADAVVLSLGYYTEVADDLTYNAGIKAILVELGRRGVAVFCAAGNDSSDRPSYPAAFAADPTFARDPCVVPLTSVGALNPDGSVAAFSNYGGWVTAAAVGVNVVSTVPVTADGSQPAPQRFVGLAGRSRSVLDPDNLGSGFASWSGTSFAAPVLAGHYLRLLRDAEQPLDLADRRALILRLRARDGSRN